LVWRSIPATEPGIAGETGPALRLLIVRDPAR